MQESRTAPVFRPSAAVCGVGEGWGRRGLGRDKEPSRPRFPWTKFVIDHEKVTDRKKFRKTLHRIYPCVILKKWIIQSNLGCVGDSVPALVNAVV